MRKFFFLWPGGDDGVCEALMRIGARRGPRAADEHQRKHTGQPDSSRRPRSRRVGRLYACVTTHSFSRVAMTRRLKPQFELRSKACTYSLIKRHCSQAKGH